MSKRTFSWLNPKLEIKKSQIEGNGVFAKRDIGKDEVLAIFGGYIISIKELVKLPKCIQDEGLQIDKNFVLGVKKKSEMEDCSFFNHCCDPNAGFRGQITLVALRNIKKGEEITFDYAMDLYNVKSYKLKCHCGSTNCRGAITDRDWKNKGIQKKYKGYFQWFVQEKIDKVKK